MWSDLTALLDGQKTDFSSIDVDTGKPCQYITEVLDNRSSFVDVTYITDLHKAKKHTSLKQKLQNQTPT